MEKDIQVVLPRENTKSMKARVVILISVKPSTARTKGPGIWNSLSEAGQQSPRENSAGSRERHLGLFKERSGSVGDGERAERCD